MKEIDVKHTFVICAYEKSIHLENCILSLLAQQSFKNGKSKIILYTSTPNDYITSLCNTYNIECFIGVGGGIGADWNGALSFVDTKYATIAHQDDIYEPEYGENIIESFETNAQLNIVFTDYYEIDGEGSYRSRNLNLKIKTAALKVMSAFNNKKYQRRVYSFGNFICCPAVSYNLSRLRGFKFNECMKMALDWDAWERIMKMPGDIKFLSGHLMAHRIHEESETTNNTVDKNREKEEYEMFRRYWGKTISRLLMKFYVKNQQGNI